MVPTLDVVVEGLANPNEFARILAAHWLEHAAVTSGDVRLTQLALDAAELPHSEFGEEIHEAIVGWPLDTDCLKRILALLVQRKEEGDDCESLETILLHASVSLLEECAAEVKGCRAIRPVIRRRLKKQRGMASWTPAQLRDEARSLENRRDAACRIEQTYFEFELDRIALDRALTNCSEVSDAEILSILDENDGENLEWYLAAISAAGRRRIASSVPRLLSAMEDEWEDAADTAARALSWMGDPSVLEAIASKYPQCDEEFQMGAAMVFESFPCAESERAVLGLLDRTVKQPMASRLALSLVRMLSSEAKRCGVPQISQDPDFGDGILDELPACMTILGHEVSGEELLEWGSHLSLGFETVNTEEMDPYRFESDADLDDDIDEGDDEESDDDLDSNEEDEDGDGDDGEEEFEEPVTVRNPFERVGRNEPCPCGSGKKFKKCCGQR